MARGFKSGSYLHDDASEVVVKVEADRFADTDFAWTAPTAGSYRQGYKGFKPRHLVGVEAGTGKSARAIVPDIGANVWTGVASAFTTKDDDGTVHTYVITSRVGELRHIAR